MVHIQGKGEARSPTRESHLVLSMRLRTDHPTRMFTLILIMRLGPMTLLLLLVMLLLLLAPCSLTLTVPLRTMLLLMLSRIPRLRLRGVLIIPGMLGIRALLLLLVLLLLPLLVMTLLILASRAKDLLHDLEDPKDDAGHDRS